MINSLLVPGRLLFVVLLLAGCGRSDAPPTVSSPAAVMTNAGAASPVAASLPDFSALVDQVGPAVVNIATIQVSKTPSLPQDHPFHDFLRRFGMPGEGEEQRSEGMGSGFIVSEDGFVLTNSHVVDEAKTVTVKLTDKREFTARVVGVDKRTDVALLKIDATGLPVVHVGDANKVKVGAWVVAVGQPFGFENTVTAGIVSAKSRSLPDESLVPFIQTDVAINPGNSGGPLFNLDGEVVGINSQIYSRTGGFMGLSFAIPIDVAMRVKEQLQTTGHVSRGKLGVAIQGVTSDLAQSFGLEKPIGALVSSVERGSPAERAGILPGDVVLAVDGQSIDANVDLARSIANLRPGQAVLLRVWRQGSARDIRATLADMEAQDTKNKDGNGPVTEVPGKFGLALRPLTAVEAQGLQVRGGLVVVEAEGIAARAGVRPGDVVLAVNGEPVLSLAQFSALASSRGVKALLVQRDETRLYVPLSEG
jgi:serine protease Do